MIYYLWYCISSTGIELPSVYFSCAWNLNRLDMAGDGIIDREGKPTSLCLKFYRFANPDYTWKGTEISGGWIFSLWCLMPYVKNSTNLVHFWNIHMKVQSCHPFFQDWTCNNRDRDRADIRFKSSCWSKQSVNTDMIL
jgi:hypothetical protein